MVEVAIFFVVLIAVFACKAASIVLATDDAVAKSVSFSWMAPKAEDAEVPVSETVGYEDVYVVRSSQAYGRRASVA